MQRRTQHYLSILSVTHNHKLCCLNMRNLSFRILGWSDDDGKLYFSLEALGKCASCFFYILECFLASLLVLTSSVFSLIFIYINSFNSYCILFSLLPLSVYMCVHVSSYICDMSCFQKSEDPWTLLPLSFVFWGPNTGFTSGLLAVDFAIWSPSCLPLKYFICMNLLYTTLIMLS